MQRNHDANCGNCPYWDVDWGANVRANMIRNGEKAECRKSHPRHSSESFTSWGLTESGDWCGEHPDFQAKEQEDMPTMVAFANGTSENSLWGVEGGRGVLYEAEFTKEIAVRIAAMYNDAIPPTDWIAVRSRLLAEGFRVQDVDGKAVSYGRPTS